MNVYVPRCAKTVRKTLFIDQVCNSWNSLGLLQHVIEAQSTNSFKNSRTDSTNTGQIWAHESYSCWANQHQVSSKFEADPSCYRLTHQQACCHFSVHLSHGVVFADVKIFRLIFDYPRYITWIGQSHTITDDIRLWILCTWSGEKVHNPYKTRIGAHRHIGAYRGAWWLATLRNMAANGGAAEIWLNKLTSLALGLILYKLKSRADILETL